MEKLLTIGQLAKICKVTPRAVRFYEEVGLLTPNETDAQTNYRYYSQEGVDQLRKILYLKELGLTLDDIKAYFSYSKEDKINLLNIQKEKYELTKELIEHLLEDEDYDLENIVDINLTGTKIQKKELEKLQGVWKLAGIYQTIKDAKFEQCPLNKFSPYQFLAFDRNGRSPWFYYANNQKIVFNTFYKPVSEIYQIFENKLFVKIDNVSQHDFCLCEEKERLTETHILVFSKFSNEYEDYRKLLFLDKKIETSINKDAIGVWNFVGVGENFSAKSYYKNNKKDAVLIIDKEGNAMYFDKLKAERFIVCGDALFDKDLSCLCKFKIDGEFLVLENKAKTYSFTGRLRNYLIFRKLI